PVCNLSASQQKCSGSCRSWVRITSALPLIATRSRISRQVCVVPVADIPSFDHFIGERPDNERFDAQNQFKLVCLFDLSHLCHSGLWTSANGANVIQGDFLMQLSSAIRAALIALTVIGVGLATAYADSGSIRFNVIKA